MYTQTGIKKNNWGTSFVVGNNFKKLHQKSLKPEIVLKKCWDQRKINPFLMTFTVQPTWIPYSKKCDNSIVINKDKVAFLDPWVKVSLCLFSLCFWQYQPLYLRPYAWGRGTLPRKCDLWLFCYQLFWISFCDRVSLCSTGKPSAFCTFTSASRLAQIMGLCSHTGSST